MPKLRTHYDNLQVSRAASNEVIRAAYQKLSQLHHPDKNPTDRERAERRIKIINDAYDVLSDPEKRRQHDMWIKEMETGFDQPKEEPVVGADFRAHREPPPPTYVRPTPSEPSVLREKKWILLTLLVVALSGTAGGIGAVAIKFIFGETSVD